MNVLMKYFCCIVFLVTAILSCKDDDNSVPELNPSSITPISTPCEFTLDDVQPNTTIVIDCVMDLDGQTITLPANVTLEYVGGDIVNGILNFSEGSLISGELLNASLILEGTNPQLIDPVFNFDPKRWGIVEGRTTSEIAQKNNDTLESIMFRVKELGGKTFKIDKIDAYFEVGKVTSTTSNTNFYATIEAINIPSDFNLVMTDNSHLRVFPNNAPKYCLLAVREANNVSITGGNLYGDRDEHDYSTGESTHEWGHVMELKAATNTTITNVKMVNGSGDGIKISELKFTYQSNHKPSKNINLKDCTFDSNRRNNISITGGSEIKVENNLILNAGIDTQNSTGTDPKVGIDVEATRASDGNGGYLLYEKAEHIMIKNNIVKGSVIAAITVHIGNNVTIESNTTENSLSYSYTHGTKIINNTITAGSLSGDTGIDAGKNTSVDTIYDNEVSGNTITGFNVGINVKNRDVKVFDNIIIDFKNGIFPKDLKNARIYNNTLTSDRESSRGVFVNLSSLDNVVIENNDITVKSNAIIFSNCNQNIEEANYSVTIKNNAFKSPSYTEVKNSMGLIFDTNNFNHGIKVFDSQSIEFKNNKINTEKHDGISLRNVNKDINIISNSISVAEGRDCVKIDEETSANEVNTSDHSCTKI